jgi:hypothetical protein
MGLDNLIDGAKMSDNSGDFLPILRNGCSTRIYDSKPPVAISREETQHGTV